MAARKDRNTTYPMSYVVLVQVVRVGPQKKISKLAGRARFGLDEDREHEVSSSISIYLRSYEQSISFLISEIA